MHQIQVRKILNFGVFLAKKLKWSLGCEVTMARQWLRSDIFGQAFRKTSLRDFHPKLRLNVDWILWPLRHIHPNIICNFWLYRRGSYEGPFEDFAGPPIIFKKFCGKNTHICLGSNRMLLAFYYRTWPCVYVFSVVGGTYFRLGIQVRKFLNLGFFWLSYQLTKSKN